MLRALVIVLVPVTLLMWLGGQLLSSRPDSTARTRIDSADEKFLAEIGPIDEEWNDALQIALATGRLNLPDQVSRLQEVRRNLSALKPGKCTEKIHRHVKAHYQLTIDHFLTFMRDGEEPDDAAEIARQRRLAERGISFCLGNQIEQPPPPPSPPESEQNNDAAQQSRINEIAEKHRKANPIN